SAFVDPRGPMSIRHPEEDPLHAAIAVSWLTVAWSSSTGVASAIVGLAAHSLSLAGLGVTVLLDVASSLVLVWRFGHERDGGTSTEHAERLAHRVASGALVGFGVVLALTSIQELAAGRHPHATALGVALAAANVLVLPVLARAKYRAATAAAS